MVSETREPLFVFGASGHAKVVIDIIEKQGQYQIAFLVDDNPNLKGAHVYGYRVIGGREKLSDTMLPAIVAIGDNVARMKVAEWLEGRGFALSIAVHPSAQIARGAVIGAGTVVMASAVVNSDTVIGNNVIVNTCAVIDHDCMIGDGVHVAPGCHLCGNVRIGHGSLIGVGTNVIPGVTIGEGVIVGAGATVISDVQDGAKIVGSPAKPI